MYFVENFTSSRRQFSAEWPITWKPLATLAQRGLRFVREGVGGQFPETLFVRFREIADVPEASPKRFRGDSGCLAFRLVEGFVDSMKAYRDK